MAKKEVLKKPIAIQEETISNHKNTKSGKKKESNAIDEIFSSKKAPNSGKKKENNEINEKKVPNSGKKKVTNEIDEIFTRKKQKKNPESEKPKEVKDPSPKISKRKKRAQVNDVFDDAPSKSRKKTGDGFVVYTEEELGIGKADAGGTPLCPFDCVCCY